MVPGAKIQKDPKVIVAANSEACYVFVEVEESSTLSTYIEYAVDQGWTKLGDVYAGIYYRSVAMNATNQEFSILKGNEVTVRTSVTKKQMNDLNVAGAVQPTLTFTAYAIQSENLPYSDDTTDLAKAQFAWGQIVNS